MKTAKCIRTLRTALNGQTQSAVSFDSEKKKTVIGPFSLSWFLPEVQCEELLLSESNSEISISGTVIACHAQISCIGVQVLITSSGVSNQTDHSETYAALLFSFNMKNISISTTKFYITFFLTVNLHDVISWKI